MKIRSGFISNSSSSSFVVFGVAVPNKEIERLAKESGKYDRYEDCYEYLEYLDGKHKLYYLYSDEGGAPKGHHIIGYQLTKCEDYTLSDKTYTLEELKAMSTKLLHKLKELGFKFNEKPLPKIFMGTRAC